MSLSTDSLTTAQVQEFLSTPTDVKEIIEFEQELDDDNLAIDIVSSYAINEGKDIVEAVYHAIDWYHFREYGTSYYEPDDENGGHIVHIDDKTFLEFILENY